MENCNFKHPAPVRCVRINSTTVYSSCDRGLVKVWDLDTTSLLRVTTPLHIVHHVFWLRYEWSPSFSKVIDAHRTSVKRLFLDDLHFLSADVEGQVMAWSVGSDVKRCLVTFKHPK